MQAQSDESFAILQQAKPVRGAPPDLRTDFIKKVYALMVVMTLITFGLASPFVFYPAATQAWCLKHFWLVALCIVLLLAQHIFHFCMMAEQCCGGSSLLRKYITMFRTVPWNYLYCCGYSVLMGVVVGFVCMAYQATSVCFVFILCSGIFVALTAYAVYTKSDFTGNGAYILVALVGLALMSILGIFFPHGHLIHRIIGGIGAIIFGWIIVYDTQLIFGHASSSERQFEYGLDMYAFASFQLYCDFINFFLYMLRFLGDKR